MLIFVGDVHGEFDHLTSKLNRSEIHNSSFLQVGDLGVGFEKKTIESEQLTVLNNQLRERNNHFYAIRGNHDDPAYFKRVSGFSNISFLDDYQILQLEGSTILLAGGAISIDRTLRELNVSHWVGEEFEYNEASVAKKIQGLKRIDVVVTHNAPDEFWPTEINDLVLRYALKDRTLLRDLKNERYKLTQFMDLLIRKKLKPRYWYYGHFHSSYSDRFKGIKYRALDCSEIIEHNL